MASNELGVDVEQRDGLEELCKGCTGHTLLLLEMVQSSWMQL